MPTEDAGSFTPPTGREILEHVWRQQIALQVVEGNNAVRQLGNPTDAALHRAMAEVSLSEIFASGTSSRVPSGDEISALTAALTEHLGILAADIIEETRSSEDGVPAEIDGMLAADAITARHLEKLSGCGKAWAQAIRDNAPTRMLKMKGVPFTGEQLSLFVGRRLGDITGGPEWTDALEVLQELYKLWMWTGSNKPPAIFSILSEALWRDVIEPRIAQKKYPAVTRGVDEAVDRVLWAPGRRTVSIEPNGQALLLVDGKPIAQVSWLPKRRHEEIIDIDAAMAPTIQQEIADLFASAHTLTCWKLVRHIVIEMYRKHFLGSESPVLTYEGGLQTLAKELGIKGGKGAHEVRQALDAGWAMAADWPDGGAVRGLWTWELEPHAPGRPAVLHITVSTQLRPGYAPQIPKRRLKERQLLPVLEDAQGKAYLPPRMGSPQLALGQVRLSTFVIEFLRENATELRKHGHVRITDADWAAMFRRAGLQLEHGRLLVERWTQAPQALLDRRGTDRYTLAAEHHRALATLLGGAQKSIEGARRQASGRRAKTAKARPRA